MWFHGAARWLFFDMNRVCILQYAVNIGFHPMDRITVYITVIIAGDIVIITQKLIILLTKRDFFFSLSLPILFNGRTRASNDASVQFGGGNGAFNTHYKVTTPVLNVVIWRHCRYAAAHSKMSRSQRCAFFLPAFFLLLFERLLNNNFRLQSPTFHCLYSGTAVL